MIRVERVPPHGSPNQLRALWGLTRYPLLAMLRNPATSTFGFLFPLGLILIFGLIGGGGGGMRLGVPTGSASEAVYSALEQSPGANLIRANRAELEQQLRLGKLDGIVESQADRVTLVLNSANPQGGLATLMVRQSVDSLNLQAAGVARPAYGLQVEEIAGRRNRYIDFALPGQIGMALISTAVFGTVFGLIFLKQALILKRLFATPVRGGTILLGQGLARLIMALAQAAVILAVGVLVFGFQLANGWLTFFGLIALSALGLAAFMGFGLAIAGWTNDANAANPLTNLVTLPQFLLSGVFFPTDVFPSWLRPLAESLPLSHFNIAMRAVATEGLGLTEILPSLVALSAWGVASYVVAARTFKWQ